MKKISFILFALATLTIFSQQKLSKEISFITENDLYVSINDDRYYTNGAFLSYRYLSKYKKENLEKRILEWSVGHEMYSPYRSIAVFKEDHDRPFAAYLYGGFGIDRIYKNNQTFKTSIQLGIIGAYAYGKELQNFIHNIYGFKEAVGWKYQVKNALALNFNVEFNKLLLKNNTNYFDVSWVNSANAGTVFTNISTGFYGRIGFKPLQNLVNSIAFNSNINNNNTRYFREVESFMFIKPTLRYALYDATLQGSFLNKKSEVTNELVPLVFNLEIGLKFTANRFRFGYTFNYNSNKSKNLRFDNGHKYGSIQIGYLLK
ncbi:lipid A deacylase LpxR family protein [Polaribacter batillariae]|uniref:Lipid A deacylase LpxR family protein n=1 Tax=Polaribacter batillariae TaxID=2808900 RepID=A0ABX7SVQ9_9FLAO|nr:lipid A deacylase LpxR family protein [Polaribacter batillariae]QTD38320.1 lipid A deacylase LpxR family protein [Polaribacter batillariae]